VLEAAAPDRVDVWRLADTPHTGGLATHPVEWEARVIPFLETHLSD
jgi:hypothetical protein